MCLMNGNETCQRFVDTLMRKEAGCGSSLPFARRQRQRQRDGGRDRGHQLRVALRCAVFEIEHQNISAGGSLRLNRRQIDESRRKPAETSLPTLPLSSGRLPRVRSFFVYPAGAIAIAIANRAGRLACRLRLRERSLARPRASRVAQLHSRARAFRVAPSSHLASLRRTGVRDGRKVPENLIRKHPRNHPFTIRRCTSRG